MGVVFSRENVRRKYAKMEQTAATPDTPPEYSAESCCTAGVAGYAMAVATRSSEEDHPVTPGEMQRMADHAACVYEVTIPCRSNGAVYWTTVATLATLKRPPTREEIQALVTTAD